MMTREMEEHIRNKAKEYVIPVQEQLCPEEVQFRNIMDKWYSENKDRLENAEFCIHNIELDDKTLRIYKLFQADKLSQIIVKADMNNTQLGIKRSPLSFLVSELAKTEFQMQELNYKKEEIMRELIQREMNGKIKGSKLE